LPSDFCTAVAEKPLCGPVEALDQAAMVNDPDSFDRGIEHRLGLQ
jgi:hypothetical protein